MTISVIIPALHEEERIGEVVAQIQSQEVRGAWPPAPQIIIVDGDPAGSTLAVIKDPHIVKLTAPKGRGNQLAAGAAIASGDILLMLHADTMLPDRAFSSIRQAVADGADWGAFRIGIDAPETAFRIIERSVDLRCRLFRLPYGDQAMFVTRKALDQTGGIPDIPLMEDVELAEKLRKGGYRFTLLTDRVRTSARRWQKDGIVRRTLKNWWIMLQYLAGVKPEKLSKGYQ